MKPANPSVPERPAFEEIFKPVFDGLINDLKAKESAMRAQEQGKSGITGGASVTFNGPPTGPNVGGNNYRA